MFFVYILYSPASERYYIGFTSNLEGRLAAHNHPSNKGWTKSFKPWNLVYSEEFGSKAHAMKREQYLKSLKNKEFLMQLIASLQ